MHCWQLTTDLQRTVVRLSLRGNPLKLYRAKHTYRDVTQDFTLAKLAILT